MGPVSDPRVVCKVPLGSPWSGRFRLQRAGFRRMRGVRRRRRSRMGWTPPRGHSRHRAACTLPSAPPPPASSPTLKTAADAQNGTSTPPAPQRTKFTSVQNARVQHQSASLTNSHWILLNNYSYSFRQKNSIFQWHHVLVYFIPLIPQQFTNQCFLLLRSIKAQYFLPFI